MSSIFRRFFSSILIFGFLPVIAVIFIIFYFQYSFEKKIISNYQQLTDVFAFNSYEAINSFAKRLEYLSYLRSIYRDDKKFLSSVLEKYPEAVFVSIVEKNGIERVRVSKNEIGKAISVVDISKEEYFIRIKKTGDGVIGDFSIKKGYPLATVVYPVGDEFIYTVLNLIDFFQNIYLTSVGKTGFIFFVSSEGKILSDRNLNLENRDIFKIISSEYGSFISKINNEKYVFVYRRVSEFDFYTVIAQSKKEMFRDLNILFYGLLFIIFLVLTVSYFVSYVIAEKLTMPISAVVDASQKVAEGNFNSKVTVESNIKELDKLIEVFNMMVEKLKEYENINIEKIMDEREKLNVIMQNIENSIALTNISGQPLYMNQSIYDIIGNENPREFFHNLVNRSVKEKTNVFDKNNRYYRFIFQIVKLQREQPLILFVIEDITAEMTLYRTREEIFRSIVHDVRAPLLNMQGYIKLLSYDTDPKTERYIKGLETESAIIFRMLENILDMARIENKTLSLNREKVNIVELISDIAGRFDIRAEYKNIEFIKEIKINEAYVSVDEELFQRALDNILSNAFKYTPSGGKVIIGIDKHDNDMIKIYVRDNGRGIEKEKLRHLFEKFRTFSKDGFGLGLSIAKTIIEMHDGRIEVDSEVNVGTEVRILMKSS